MRKQHWLCAAFLLSLAVSALAQEYTNRREVLQDETLRQDFIIQGEYIAKTDKGAMGLHIIADGDGKFRVVSYPGGLPGDGWKAGQPRMLGAAELDGNDISFHLTEGRGVADGQVVKMPENIKAKGKITIETPQGGAAGQSRNTSVKIEVTSDNMPTQLYEKQNRRSPTLGLAPPTGAIVLFDGSNVDWFPGAKINEQPRGNTLWSDATSKEFEKRPYKMHLEFLLSYMPTKRGQQRSNSGVYLDQRYECQVLDSFGLEGEDNECGGFYKQAKPLINMCFPPLTWQTYDFEFTPAKYDGETKVENARVTVKHNGVLIHDNHEFQTKTPGQSPEGPEPKGVFLQGHGNKVQYRNIWIQYL